MNPLLPATATLSGLALTLGVNATTAAVADRPPKPLNIVLIISDQLSARALPLYGNPALSTPNLDRLMREGATFNNSVCIVPFSSPTRATLVTGRYPVSTGIITNVEARQGNGPLDVNMPITESLLFDKGYVTGNYGKWHLGPINSWPCYANKKNARDIYDLTYFGAFAAVRAARHPVAAPPKPGEAITNPAAEQGYGRYQTAYANSKWKTAPADLKRELGSFGRLGTPSEDYNWTLVTKDGTDFIKAHKDASFMVTISLGPPHPDFNIPDPWYGRVDPAKIQFNPSSFTHPERYLNTKDYKVGQYLGEEGSREKMRCYYAMIAFVDDMVGRILKTIDDCGLAENTLVVFISDHGDPIGTQGFLFDKSIPDFLEEQLRVPTFMRLPGVIPAGKKIEASFSSVDLAPTLRDYLGVNTVPVQGRSFRPLLDGTEKDDKGAGFAVSVRPEARCIRGEIDGKIYIYSKMFKAPGSPAAAKGKAAPKPGAKAATNLAAKTYEELFNLTDDPWQMKNVIADPAYAAIKARLMAEYDKYADRSGDRRIEDLPAKGLVTWGNFRNVPPVEGAGIPPEE